MSVIRIMHLSDLHFGRDHSLGPGRDLGRPPQYSPSLVELLVQDAERLEAKPDLVVITGDLTSTGARAEFEQALTFLKSLSEAFAIEPRRVVLVPGNHDVTWGTTPDSVSHSEYRHFASEFYNVPVTATAVSSARESDVYILGLDSTLLESEARPGTGLVGPEQLQAAAQTMRENAKHARVKLLALHHHLLPVAWVEPLPESHPGGRPLDARAVLAWAQKHRVHALLHGHQHESFAATLHLASEPGGPLAVVGAPSAAGIYRPPQTPNGYQWVYVDYPHLRVQSRQLTATNTFEPGSSADFVLEATGVFQVTAIPSARSHREVTTAEVRTLTRAASDWVIERLAAEYGPRGGLRGVVQLGGALQVRDGQQVIRSLPSDDLVERRVLEVFRDLADLINERVGDGRKSAMMICATAVLGGLEAVDRGCDENAVARGIESAAREALTKVQQVTTPAAPAMLANVARTAALGRTDVATAVVEARTAAGKFGTVVVEEGELAESLTIQVVPGPPHQFPPPRVATWSASVVGQIPITLERPFFLVANGKLLGKGHVLRPMQIAAESKRPIVLVCAGLDGEAADVVELNSRKGTVLAFPVVYEGVEGIGLFDDIALITGAEVQRMALGADLTKIGPEHLGSTASARIDRRGFSVIPPAAVDAKTVTHIMGLRAFSSQLLCEQVVGRGLRRTSYELNADGLFDAEFVNVFGVPFTFLPHESDDETPPPPPKPRTRVEALSERVALEMEWPNVLRVDQSYETRLTLDLEQLPPLQIDATEVRTLAELAPTVDGKPDWTKAKEVDLEELGKRSRLQTIAFRTAAETFDLVKPGWPGSREVLLGQLIGLVDRFLRSDRIVIRPEVFARDPLRRRILLTLNMSRIVQHLFDRIRHENVTARRLVLDREHPIRRTGDMLPWYTARPCAPTKRSHVNFCVFDSTWEATEAFAFDQHPQVDAWVRNDHLGFEVHYVFQGAVRKYRPDFLLRLRNGIRLVVEVKGRDTQEDQTKREFLAEWVEAVNEHGGFGRWVWDVSFSPSDLVDLLAKHAAPTG